MVDGVVLDVQLAQAQTFGQPRAPDERSETGVEPRARLAGNRQQLAIAPEVFRPALDLLPRDLNRFVIVEGLERSEAFLADPQRLRGKRGLAQMTLESE